jgi:hypothetical protein
MQLAHVLSFSHKLPHLEIQYENLYNDVGTNLVQAYKQ